MEVNLLFPVRIETEDGSHIFFVDCTNQKVFYTNGLEVADNLKESILTDLWQQRQVMAVESPVELVQEALNTKKEISSRGDREHGSI
jgi:hypothetical protein